MSLLAFLSPGERRGVSPTCFDNSRRAYASTLAKSLQLVRQGAASLGHDGLFQLVGHGRQLLHPNLHPAVRTAPGDRVHLPELRVVLLGVVVAELRPATLLAKDR